MVRPGAEDPEPGLPGYPISLRVHVALLAIFAVLGLVFTIQVLNEKPVDPGYMIMTASDLKTVTLVLYWGTFGAYFLITTVLRLTRRATVVTYGLALFLSPWTLMVALIALEQLQHLAR